MTVPSVDLVVRTMHTTYTRRSALTTLYSPV